jgi:23S rRNA (uracil1939-C5)-methyltransferase
VLVRRAVRLLDPQPGESVADFFCGLGNFTLPLATRAGRVIGLEGHEGLVERARQAAARAGLSERTRFHARNLFEWSGDDWRMLSEDAGPIGAVLVDPPREGALAVVQSLAGSLLRPRRLVYVSCNPATLARDCAVLVHEGGWQLAAAGVVNMFPHTAHVESIALLHPEGASAPLV